MTKQLFATILTIGSLFSCQQTNQPDNPKNAILKEIDNGNFTMADSLINHALTLKIPEEDKQDLRFEQERMRRIRMDFKRDETYIKEKLSSTFPELTDEQLRAWEEDKSLEMKTIDGERKYFNWAHRNLFRVNTEAKKHLQLDANQSDGITEFCQSFVPQLIEELKQNNSHTSEAKTFKINYALRVDSGAVKQGDTLRAWLPYPKPNIPRSFDIKLLRTNHDNYSIAPENQAHRSIYFEKVVDNADAHEFTITYQVSTRGQWYGNDLAQISPYNTDAELYQNYTNERTPHIVFTNEIKNLTDSIVGDIKNPYEITKTIFNWIDNNIPWASAREYSTFKNIPAYALENMHGDCGIQTLLFITMARYKGIPAKWQSGWMLIPGEVGLHDWAEVYYEGLGWVPVDQSFEKINHENEDVKYFYSCGIDPYRLIVNDDFSQEFYPTKKHFRSETVDFQRGEVETQERNLYFNEWSYHMDVSFID